MAQDASASQAHPSSPPSLLRFIHCCWAMVVAGAVELDTFGAMLSGGCSNGEHCGVVDVEVSTCHMINIKFQLSLLLCPQRMFLASVILVSKFSQNKYYSNHAWAKLSCCMYFLYFLMLFTYI